VTTPVLSSFFGKSVLGDPALSSLLGSPLAGGVDSAVSPDQMLFDNTVPAPQMPSKPPAQISTRNEPGTVPAPPGAALPSGDAARAIDEAMSFLGTDYEWGGNGADGRVDCSGLLYAAFNRAGIKMPRYRAVDYGHMGMAVSLQDARPGDVVYFDEPGDTDHVGLYLGNGKYIQAPHTGAKVQISTIGQGSSAQIRRVLPDSATHGMPVDPNGNLTFHGDNQLFTGGKAPADHPGVQQDPILQLHAMDNAMTVQAIEGPQNLSGILDSFSTATPDSLFGQAHQAASDHLSMALAPAPPKAAGGSGGSFAAFLNAEGQQESGGKYDIRNSIGAIGKYQVMSENVGPWTQEALGHRLTPEQFQKSPAAQEAVARFKFGQLVDQYGFRGAAAAWYSGQAKRENDYSHVGNGPSVGQYVDEVMARM
jgi:hypothetical protein